MFIVEYPDVYESFVRAFHEVLLEFFDPEKEQRVILSESECIIQPAVVDFTGRYLTAPVKNTITILFDRYSDEKHEHCVVGTSTNKNKGFEKRVKLKLNLFVSVPIDSSTTPNHANHRQAIRIFDNVNSIIDTQTKMFEDRNIHALHLSSPEQFAPATEFAYCKGTLECEIRALYLKSGCSD